MAATHLHFNCTSGISGDMTLGALVDLGAPAREIEQGLKGLAIGPFALRAEPVRRQGIMGVKVHVEVEEDAHAHRRLEDIVRLVEAAGLPSRAAERSKRAWRLLAEAEAHVHGSTPEAIHFHEAGAKDAILDVAGSMFALELLGIESVSVSTLTVGSGMIQCNHGRMPVPTPATAELLHGLAQTPGEVVAEMVTPTGAAILRALLAERETSGPLSTGALITRRIGYGAGDRVFEGRANFLRVLLCDAPAASSPPELPVERQTVLLLETEIDDMSPEWAGYLMDKLLADGALDVQFSPVQMKKNRPALRLRVVADPARERVLAERILRETSTFGLRRQTVERWCLARRIERVETPLGPVAVKVGLWGETPIKASPEYEDCRALAERTGRPLAEIYELARAAIREKAGL